MADFSNSQLLDFNLKAENVWSNGTQAQNFVSHADSAKALLEHQTATFKELDDKDKDHKVKIMWLDACAIEDEDCVENCTLDGDPLNDNYKDYEYDMCRKVDFSVNRDTLRSSQYNRDEVIAKGLAMAIKRLDEWWAVQVLLKAKAFAGVNVAASPWTFDDATMTTQVPTASYNLTMIAYLIKQAMLNQMNAPFYLEKGDLFVPVKNAEFDNGNADGKGNNARANALDMTFDMWNFAKSGITEDMFAIDSSAMAMKTYARNPDTPTLLGGDIQQTIYTVASQMLPGVRYDVYYGLTCQSATVGGKIRTQYVDTWRLETTGLIALNPEACEVTVGGETYNPTGVLSYSQV